MINKLLKHLLPSGYDKLDIKADNDAVFSLILGDTNIGQLSFQNGDWKFSYSSEFKTHSTLKPLADFPDVNKEYVSKILWPFFTSRIPSTSRTRVKNLIDKEGIKETDLLNLLRRFGKRTIANPFILKEYAQ